MKKILKIILICFLILAAIVVILVFGFLTVIGAIDWRFGATCGYTASGFGTCGYDGALRDCDCTGEKYLFYTGITDTGHQIKCAGKASNFRNIPLPPNLCLQDPNERCFVYGGEVCGQSYLDCLNKTKTNELNFGNNYIPGRAALLFKDNINNSEIDEFVNEHVTKYGLNATIRNTQAIITVPEGYEIEWVCRFKGMSSVKSSSLDHIAYASSGSMPIVDQDVEEALNNSKWVSVSISLSDFGSKESNKEVQQRIISNFSEEEFNLAWMSSSGRSFAGNITKEGLDKLRENPDVLRVLLPIYGSGSMENDFE